MKNIFTIWIDRDYRHDVKADKLLTDDEIEDIQKLANSVDSSELVCLCTTDGDVTFFIDGVTLVSLAPWELMEEFTKELVLANDLIEKQNREIESLKREVLVINMLLENKC